jgi:hypothetical protein
MLRTCGDPHCPEPYCHVSCPECGSLDLEHRCPVDMDDDELERWHQRHEVTS